MQPYLKLIPLLIVSMLSGCAEMQVKKISPKNKNTSIDDETLGFRYYLSRPYVVVKQQVPVSETIELLILNKNKVKGAQAYAAIQKSDVEAAMASAARRSRQRRSTANGSLESISASEWSTIRTALLRDSEKGGGGDQFASNGIRQASATTMDSVANANSVAMTETNSAAMLTPATLPATPDTTKTVDLSGAIDVVFLPDMDEQYAVHNKNVLAKSTYALEFRDGWELASVNGEFDSTEVAIEVLNTVDTAITAARDISLARIGVAAPSSADVESAMDAISLADKGPTASYVVLEVVHTEFIKPGFYRVNKPWEIGGGLEATGGGLLAKMGLETQVLTTVRAAKTQTLP